MPKYKVTTHNDNKIIRRDNDDGTWSEIPFDEGNEDYKEYKKELVDETVTDDIDESIALLKALIAEKQAAKKAKQGG